MFSKRKYIDVSGGHGAGQKRQQVYGLSSPYFLSSSGSNLMSSALNPLSGQPPPFPVVKLRGLPFDCSELDVLDFLHGADIVDILFVHRGGRFSGEAFCVLAYPLQVDWAMQRNRQNMGRRYIEVFRSNRQEYYGAVAHEISDTRLSSPPCTASKKKSIDNAKDLAEHTGVVRMRGLPYSAGKDDVLEFFVDYELSEEHVHIVLNSEGRPSGEAFVEFLNAEDSKSAMVKDRMTLGSRYIELFPSNAVEMDDAILRGR